jgi:hypothetical protein
VPGTEITPPEMMIGSKTRTISGIGFSFEERVSPAPK